MNGIIRIIIGGVAIFALISVWLLFSKCLLRLAHNNFEAGNLAKAKRFARLLLFTHLKACGFELLAEISQNNAEYGEAVELFVRALRHDNTLDNSWAGLFECYICVGNISEATRTISEAASLLPDNELIQVYKILVTKLDFKWLSQDELNLLAKHNIKLGQEGPQPNFMDILLKVCKP